MIVACADDVASEGRAAGLRAEMEPVEPSGKVASAVTREDVEVIAMGTKSKGS